jgi:hypothetical protein
MSFVSNGGKLKLYTLLNGFLFSTPTQPRFSFERMIHYIECSFKFILKVLESRLRTYHSSVKTQTTKK